MQCFALALCVVVALSANAPVALVHHSSAVSLETAEQPDGRLDIDVDIGSDEETWSTSPVWVAIGIIAVVLLILIVVLAVLGGGYVRH